MNEPTTSHDLAILNHRLEALHADLSDLKAAMRDVASALVKLTVLEERQSQSSAALERAFALLEKLEGRLATLEHGQPIGRMVNRWVTGAAWSAAGLVAIVVLKRAGLL